MQGCSCSSSLLEICSPKWDLLGRDKIVDILQSDRDQYSKVHRNHFGYYCNQKLMQDIKTASYDDKYTLEKIYIRYLYENIKS